ncbi:hypothetical protein [Luteolibacter sp. AS25]|uniref:hypothetical protein n=1 Tax=Luteolibacter sp. AS25 TaxID=3135776 RepID=UPI00398B39B9
MKTKPIIAFLVTAGLCFAAEPSYYNRLRIPEGATQLEYAKISIPLANKARIALFLYEQGRKENLFVELRPDQARDLAGDGYKQIEGFKPILVKWTFVEPTDEKGIGLVTSHTPTVYIKDDTLFVSSSGIDIGDVSKTAEGALIIQVANNPKDVVFKLFKVGW